MSRKCLIKTKDTSTKFIQVCSTSRDHYLKEISRITMIRKRNMGNMPTIKIIPSGQHLEYHRKLLKPLLQPPRIPKTMVNRSFDHKLPKVLSRSVDKNPFENKNSYKDIMGYETIKDINTSLIEKKLTMDKSECDYSTNTRYRGELKTMSMKHSELQKYLQGLERTKKIHIGTIPTVKSISQLRNSSKSPLLSGDTNTEQDDVYLIHPDRVLEENTGMSPRKKRHASISYKSPSNEFSLKVEPRKKVLNAIKQLGEDKETYMKFYHLKEALLPKELTVHSYYQDDVSRWRPSAREGSILFFHKNILEDEQFLLYGGMNNEILQEIVELNIDNIDNKVYWEKHTKEITCLNEYGKPSKHALELGRGGISSIVYTEVNPFNNQSRQNCVILYGSGKIVKFTPNKSEFRILNQYGRLHEDRQYHSACRFGKYMICYGGINNFKNILDKLCCFDLIEQQWKDVKVIPNSINRWVKSKHSGKVNLDCDDGPGPLYHHRWAPVFYRQREEYFDEFLYDNLGVEDSDIGIQDPLIKMPKIKWENVGKYLHQEGIYLFGGKSLLGKITNDLWCLKICDKREALIAIEMEENYRIRHKFPSLKKFENIDYHSYFQWERMETQGISPSPRYQHCVEYYDKMNFLIIYGGKGTSEGKEVLNDLHLLRMDNLMWIKVNLRGMELKPRANFSSIIQTQSYHRKIRDQTDSTKLIIFGGIKENMHYTSDTFILELDQDRIEELIQKENDEIERKKVEEELALLEASRQF
ncbi:unnamed protein product [Moneuplotes crassus]|uniref:Kelch motif family protein n=1 Tax=Euplotes crassus TaxID=5936 RepID=A0AAD1Y2D9_EUPCR|nr:unnamed protein product [Moneuplotes crassus]